MRIDEIAQLLSAAWTIPASKVKDVANRHRFN